MLGVFGVDALTVEGGKLMSYQGPSGCFANGDK